METPVEVISLDNGLALQLYDHSKRLAADRWNVVLAARIEINVDDVLEDLPDLNPERVHVLLGDTVVYEQHRETVFVPEDERGDAYGALRSSLLDSQLKYIARPDFASLYVLKCFRDADKISGRPVV